MGDGIKEVPMSYGGDDWPGWDEMLPLGNGWFLGTPQVHRTVRRWAVRQVEWRRTSHMGKVGIIHRWYYLTRTAADRKVEREKARVA